MNKDKYVFAQLVGFLDNFKFLRVVKKYGGDKYVRSYTYWNQLLTMMFWQLSNRESLRELIVAMEAHAGKLYHLGIGKSVTCSNLSKANEQREYRIFEEFAFSMILEASLPTGPVSETSSTNRISKMSMTSMIQVNRIYLIFNPVQFLVDSNELPNSMQSYAVECF